MVFHPSSGLNDCCGSWQIHGFVYEHYAAPDTFIIGLNRAFSDAECVDAQLRLLSALRAGAAVCLG